MITARNFVPGRLWLITHRCDGGEALFKDSLDRRRWLYWLFQARRRFGLSVLNYVVLRNQVQLLVMDRGRGEIPCSMQLIARGMAEDYNRYHQRQGAFWEGRYSATMAEAGASLSDLLVTMDLSLVHSGCANHPYGWRESGFFELQYPPPRARRIDTSALQRLLSPLDFPQLQRQRRLWVRSALRARAVEGRTCTPRKLLRSTRAIDVSS